MAVARRSRQEFLKFLLVGGVSFLVHNLVYLVLVYAGCNHTIAYSLGYMSWMVVNFLLSSYYTFRSKPTLKRALGFMISSGVYYLVQLASFTLCSLCHVPDIIITPVVYTISFPINFIMVRYVLRQ